MKKNITSILLALVLIVSSAVVAFAADGAEYPENIRTRGVHDWDATKK